MKPSRPWLLIGLLLYAVAMRWLPYVLRNCDVKLDPTILFYPWNFSPLTAACLFGGALLANRRLAFALPLAALVVSDIGIGVLSGHAEWAFPPGRWLAYACYAAAVALGLCLRGWSGFRRLTGALGMGLAFEVVFFLVTNLVYFYGSGSLYPPTFEGLVQCYLAALPFFRSSVVATLGFALLAFSPLGAFAPREAEQVKNDLVPAPVT
jgi:hypothetical protein